MKKAILISFVLAMFVSSCSKDDSFVNEDGAKRGTIIEVRKGNTVSVEQVVRYVTELDAAPSSQYNVTLYYITYRTVFQGRFINTSGLMFLPDGPSDTKLLVYFHGTQIPIRSLEETQIPTYYTGDSTSGDDFKEVKNTGLTWASAGYAVFMPDYIGFAMTRDREHPYIYYPELFNANVDGIVASKSFLTERGLYSGNDVLIAGWSQGGGAALSANKLIQDWNSGKTTSEKINVTGTSCLAGPFNFYRSLTDILQRNPSNIVVFIQSWGIYTVNKFSGLKRPADQIWKQPVFDQMSSILLGSDVPDKVYTDYFINGILNGTDTQMIDLCKANSYYEGWAPTGKVFLYHGTDDDTVQPFNSSDAETGLKAALSASGGNPDNVQLTMIPGADHLTGLGAYIKQTLDNFNAIR